ncbi:MAG TPA: prolyl oligopeptidase family serine peptidase [Pirellulaceae bacterium]
MNRLSSLSVSNHAIAAAHRPARPLMRTRPRRELPQCVLVPQHYERNYAYPLLVWLHDAGGNERELKKIMPLVSLRNYVSVAVRGTSSHQRGFAWPESADAILAAESRVDEAVAQAKQRFHVHPSRIFIAGAGAGGTMALRLALRWPDRYAGGGSIGGCFPVGQSPLARLQLARRSRLLIMHCRDSETYRVEQVCDELSLFHAAGMSVTLRQYPCGDELTTQMFRDLDVWLMEQVTGVPSTEPNDAPLPSEWN